MVPVERVDASEWAAIELAFAAVEGCRQDESIIAEFQEEVPPVEQNSAKRVLPAWFTAPPVRKEFQPLCFRGKIVYSRTPKEVEDSVIELKQKILASKNGLSPGDKVPMGFDIEWKPTFRRGRAPGRTAVMQLCLDSRICYVMHIFHSGIPEVLRELLQDDSICKVGVAIHGDADKLHLDYGIRVTGLVDLASMANAKFGAERKWSLSSLVEEFTCRAVAKPADIRCGNWEIQPLSKAQLEYAATDAFASLYLYQVLATFSEPSNTEEEPSLIYSDPKQITEHNAKIGSTVAIS